jgi:hypothetical protein
MTKAEFVQEFEERTGLEMLSAGWWWPLVYFDYSCGSVEFRHTTKSLYSRAHLEAAIKAVKGEKN